MHYNPFSYVHSEKDILKLVTTLMTNTKVKAAAAIHSGRKANDFCSLRLSHICIMKLLSKNKTLRPGNRKVMFQFQHCCQ